jgi:hypothetical protein
VVHIYFYGCDVNSWQHIGLDNKVPVIFSFFIFEVGFLSSSRSCLCFSSHLRNILVVKHLRKLQNTISIPRGICEDSLRLSAFPIQKVDYGKKGQT